MYKVRTRTVSVAPYWLTYIEVKTAWWKPWSKIEEAYEYPYGDYKPVMQHWTTLTRKVAVKYIEDHLKTKEQYVQHNKAQRNRFKKLSSGYSKPSDRVVNYIR